MTLFSDQAHAAATTADVAIAQQERLGVTTAVHALVWLPYPAEMRRDHALHTMLRSFHRQARLAGVNVDYTMLTRAVTR